MLSIDQAFQWVGVIALGTLLGNVTVMMVRRVTRPRAQREESRS